MKIDRDNIFEILEKSNISPDKDYGQNFLTDSFVSEKIVSSMGIETADYVLEIGPGLGSLTHFLAAYNNSIDVVDIDDNMINFLKVVYQDNKNINIVHADIRKHDVSKYQKVVANLPYNITTEAITYLLLEGTQMKRAVLMCQSEAFAHVNDTSGSEYGPLSVLAHLIGDVKRLFSVKKGSFTPAPKIDSVVFSIDVNNRINQNIIDAFKLSKALFLNRRKTIYNNLSNYSKNRELAENVLTKLKIPLNFRPEQVKPNEYLELSNLLTLLSK